MKKLFIVIIIIVMVLSMVACSCSNEPTDEPVINEPEQQEVGPVLGGWHFAEDKEVNDELKMMFDTAAGEEFAFRPVELVAIQVVSGTNYLFRCVNDIGEEKLVGVYKSLDGLCTLLDESLIPAIEYVEK